jgi:hypothetical protein
MIISDCYLDFVLARSLRKTWGNFEASLLKHHECFSIFILDALDSRYATCIIVNKYWQSVFKLLSRAYSKSWKLTLEVWSLQIS